MEGLRERKRAHARAATLDAALALFAARGYDNVTVADICTAAQIAPRTFFRYFPAKEDVLAEPVREMTVRMDDAIAAAPDLPVPELLRRAFADLAEYVLSHRRRLVVYVRVAREAAGVRTSPLHIMYDYERDLADRLSRHAGLDTPDWRTRLQVARASAAFRVWFDDVIRDRTPDPLTHFTEVFTFPD